MRIPNAPRLLHTADAPIEIGRITILQIIHRHDCPLDNKRLVTHQHPHPKTFPRKPLWCPQTAQTQRLSRFVHNIRLAIQNIRTAGMRLPAVLIVSIFTCFRCHSPGGSLGAWSSRPASDSSAMRRITGSSRSTSSSPSRRSARIA